MIIVCINVYFMTVTKMIQSSGKGHPVPTPPRAYATPCLRHPVPTHAHSRWGDFEAPPPVHAPTRLSTLITASFSHYRLD